MAPFFEKRRINGAAFFKQSFELKIKGELIPNIHRKG
jgi:hypothetical protein